MLHISLDPAECLWKHRLMQSGTIVVTVGSLDRKVESNGESVQIGGGQWTSAIGL